MTQPGAALHARLTHKRALVNAAQELGRDSLISRTGDVTVLVLTASSAAESGRAESAPHPRSLEASMLD